MITFQNFLRKTAAATKQAWIDEVVRLKITDFERNYDRICVLEELLNNASEKLIRDKLINYVKSDVLNSEKMTL